MNDLGKLIVAKGFKIFPKVQKIAESGHIEHVNRISVRSDEIWRNFAILARKFTLDRNQSDSPTLLKGHIGIVDSVTRLGD